MMARGFVLPNPMPENTVIVETGDSSPELDWP